MGDTLATFPVVVRLAYTMCSPQGSYRLARLADKYGAEIPVPNLLTHLAGGCRYWGARAILAFPAAEPISAISGARRPRSATGPRESLPLQTPPPI
jgi:hypothetical protein